MLPKSPISALPGERLAGMGHNQGPPLDAGFSFRKFAWKKARAELMPRLPLEVVRRRVRRAQELGLAYPQYASILLGTGRDIIGFLYTCQALGLRLGRTPPVPGPVSAKLNGLNGCRRIVLADQDPGAVAAALARAGLTLDRVGEAPALRANRPASRDAIRAVLDPYQLPSDAVVLVGDAPHEKVWADAAGLARFLPADSYFPARG
ncbi:MAG: hypothetical protein AAF674_06290 [Pseudomonadota bacterium]